MGIDGHGARAQHVGALTPIYVIQSHCDSNIKLIAMAFASRSLVINHRNTVRISIVR